jgi:methionyl-tRNA formyltransferase
VTIMKMDAGLDTGPILSTRRTPILPDDDSQILHDRLAQLGAELLLETIPGYVAGKISPQPQPAEGSTYAAKITKEDGQIDWNWSAQKIWNRLRAFTPWPGAFTFCNGKLLKIWKASLAQDGCYEGISIHNSGIATGTILSANADGILVLCGKDALMIFELQRESGRRLPAEQFLSGFPLQTGLRLR